MSLGRKLNKSNTTSSDFMYLKGLYWRAQASKSERALNKADEETRLLQHNLTEEERRVLVNMSVDAATRIGVKRSVLKLGRLGEFGRESENR